MDRRLLLRTGAALAAALAGGAAGTASWAAVPAVQPTTAAALAALRARPMADLQGTARRLSEWQGRPMLLNFWASWCTPCAREMPQLDALQKQFPQIQFIGIGIDTVAKIRKFLLKVPVSYPLLALGASGIDTLRDLGDTAAGLPFTLILATDGSVKRSILGKIQPEDVRNTLASLI
ncbi:TlpA disulfide reductase family protein [Bordetella sp. FB-8]|uniref:TlpA family protein disulfide reductase n=1 Tax=Bordetella sp. FB-8 TaxID=1159870 RepID=UPI000374BE01|nr:TlpA disulfide reductase family protein [Bordetella sp. FB-8]